MKTAKLIRAASVGILSLGLTALPFSISASAQDTTPSNGTTAPRVGDVEFDWGWLGLLGLVGLAGLAGRKRHDEHPQHHEYRNEVPTTPQTNVPSGPRPDAPRYRDPYRDPK